MTGRYLRAPLAAALALALIAAAITLLPAFTAVLVIGGVFLSLAFLYLPEIAIYFLVFAIPFGSLLPIPIAGANVTAADGMLLLALGLWLARQITRRRISLRPAPLLIPFALFIFAAGLSLTGALSLQASAKELTKWVEMAAIYWLIVQEFGPVQVMRALAAIMLAGLAEAAIGYYQSLLGVGPAGFLLFGGTNLRAFGTFDQPNPYAGYLGLIIPLAFGVTLGVLGTDPALRREVGMLPVLPKRRPHPLPPPRFQGGDERFLESGVALATPLSRNQIPRSPLGSGARGEGTPARKQEFGAIQEQRLPPLQPAARLALLLLAAGTLAAALAALFFSLSRGAWLGVAAALIVTLIIRSKRAAVLALIAALLLSIVILLGQLNLIPDVVSARFSGVSDYFGFQDVRGVPVNDANFAIVERMAHWQAAWDMFDAHTWLGVGIGNYAAVYPAYALPHWDDPLGHAHNYYLNVLAESGIVGEAGYLLLWVVIFWTAWRAVRSTGGLAQGIAAGAFGVLIALSVHNLFDNLFVHSMQMQVGITLGLIQVVRRPAIPRATTHGSWLSGDGEAVEG